MGKLFDQFIHSLTHSLARSLTHCMTDWLTDWPTHSLIHSRTNLLNWVFNQWLRRWKKLYQFSFAFLALGVAKFGGSCISDVFWSVRKCKYVFYLNNKYYGLHNSSFPLALTYDLLEGRLEDNNYHFLSLWYVKQRFHVTVCLLSNRSQMTSMCAKNVSDTVT